MQQPQIPDDYVLTHFKQGVRTALAREGHALTSGESSVVTAYLSLPSSAAALFARLHGRVGAVFRIDKLAYAEVPCPADSARTLVDAGFARSSGQIPTHQLVQRHTVPELRAACASLGQPTGGRRADIVERLTKHSHRHLLEGECIAVRHQGLFRRLLRVYIGDHAGDLSRVVLDLMGVFRFASYTPTTGQSLFGNRRELLAYEEALQIVYEERTEEEWAALATGLLAALEAAPYRPKRQQRFSGHRLYARGASRAIRALERTEGPMAALPFYKRLSALDRDNVKAIALRMALCLDRTGAPKVGAAMCADARSDSLRCPEDLALERTGRRLARRAGIPWSSPPALREAPRRSWVLPMVSDHPPRFETAEGPLPVEAAVVADLQRHGRTAIHGESAPWTTLFGLLFYPAMFAPVPGMLPSARLMAPLDLRTPHFAQRRETIVRSILYDISQGRAPEMLSTAVQAHHGEGIAGVYWDLLNLAGLQSMARLIGPAGLSTIMSHLVADPRRAWSGMPDLMILPGEDDKLPPGLLFAELKSPSDTLHDNQRCWHHSLLEAGLSVEVWRVGPQKVS